MSVKTRERKNSLMSTTTDFSDVPARFKQQKNQSFNEDEIFPPNEFASHSQQSNNLKTNENTSYFGQATSDGQSFRPDSRLNKQENVNPRQYSFAPQVQEESESPYSSSSKYPSQQLTYPQRDREVYTFHQKEQDQLYQQRNGIPSTNLLSANTKNIQTNLNEPPYPQLKSQDWTPKPPLFQLNDNRMMHSNGSPQDQMANNQQNYAQQIFNQQNLPQQNYPQQNYPQQNYPQQNYPQQNYPQQNYPQQNLNNKFTNEYSSENINQQQINRPRMANGSQGMSNDKNYMTNDFQKNALPNLFLQSDSIPQEVLFLLAEEDNHIGKFRTKVEKEKAKVETDMGIFKTECINLIEELKFQMQNFIDEHYKRYICVYAAFKDEIIQLKQQKLSAPLHLAQPLPKTDLTNASNSNLIRELEDLQYKNQLSKLNQYVGDLNKTRHMRIGEISKDLLQLTSSGSNLYNTDSTTKQLGLIKQEIKLQLSLRFEQMSDFIQPLDYIINNNKLQSRATSAQNQSRQTFNSMQKSEQEMYNHPHHGQREFNHPYQQQNELQLQQQIQARKVQGQELRQIPVKNNEKEQPQFSTPFPIKQKASVLENEVNSHQGYAPNQSETLQLKQSRFIQLNHAQMPLCFISIRDDLVATGSRDGKIKVWDGQKEMKQFEGHIGGVCCLAVIRQQGIPIFMVSGSDHVENSIIVWNLQTYTKVCHLDGHAAAVVALLSLEDGHTIVSASYDKSLLIWDIDMDNQQAVQKLGSAHNNAITCLSLSPDKQYFISGGLDCSLNIWKIKYRKDGRFESTFLERTLKNNSIVCSLSSYSQDNQLRILVGSKDGKIREWNAVNGELEKQVAVCSGPIVEMIVFQGHQSTLVLSMSTKDKNLVLSNLETGDNLVVDVQEGINMEYGCGVFPKMSLYRDKLMVISQSDTDQNLTEYSLDWS